ncbi:hypothetical protein PPERSA_12205 [Pseudocohnilembus persalinus]|uniref:Uncharacterized protein n=1 Tax=Pseudocohnilembus persalinus TaxID=266149 RepID=A0A0V0R8M5_PSEPJ|nr:hypothetical protein PPERSA_12205 [Pseudocohnilembus persalinus]|eukprot:KRX10854.1 hypothetical protein PPERSA_12205 [Pseudocohnilembus persalinus]
MSLQVSLKILVGAFFYLKFEKIEEAQKLLTLIFLLGYSSERKLNILMFEIFQNIFGDFRFKSPWSIIKEKLVYEEIKQSQNLEGKQKNLQGKQNSNFIEIQSEQQSSQSEYDEFDEENDEQGELLCDGLNSNQFMDIGYDFLEILNIQVSENKRQKNYQHQDDIQNKIQNIDENNQNDLLFQEKCQIIYFFMFVFLNPNLGLIVENQNADKINVYKMKEFIISLKNNFMDENVNA